MADNYGFFLIQALDDSGDPLSGAKLYAYEDDGGTTDKSLYTDKALSAAAAQPVVSDSSGRFGDLYGSGAYKLVLKDTNDTTIWTRNGINSGTSNATDTLAVVDTQAALTALDMTDPNTATTVLVRGGAAAYDGDQLIFYWSASSTATPVANQILQNDAGGTGRHIRLEVPKQASASELSALTETLTRSLSPADLQTAFDNIHTLDDASATAGPDITNQRDSDTPAANDFLGRNLYSGKNDAAEDVTYAGIGAQIINPADGAEDGAVILYAMIAGTLTAVARIGMLTDTVQGFNLLVGDYYKNSTSNAAIEFSITTGQTVTADTTLTVAHSLSAKPQVVIPILVCGTADLGYSAGDWVHPFASLDNTGDKGITVWADSTNVNIEQGNLIQIISQTSQNVEDITVGNWTWSILYGIFNV